MPNEVRVVNKSGSIFRSSGRKHSPMEAVGPCSRADCLFVTDWGQANILDFGLARVAEKLPAASSAGMPTLGDGLTRTLLYGRSP